MPQGHWNSKVLNMTFLRQNLGDYRKNPKNLDTQKFALITLKVEQGGITLE